MNRTHRFVVIGAVTGLLLAANSRTGYRAQLQDILSLGSGLDEKTVAAGLKDALAVGTERTVVQTSKVDGFLRNALIRIALPGQYKEMADLSRKLGFGHEVDALEVGMNRAAEKAAGEARPIFSDALKKITVTDAVHILRGGDHAATEYFRKRTQDALRVKFRPIVTKNMQKVGLYQSYNRVAERYDKLPLVSHPALNLDDYVTDKTLSGLFAVLGQQEKRIRKDPAARTTDLLRKVFGQK